MVNADDDELLLTGGSNPAAQSIFENYNDNLDPSEMPRNPDGGFGHWAQRDLDAIADELDFVCNENGIYVEGKASMEAASIPFMVGFSNVIGSGVGVQDQVADTHGQVVEGPLNAMCGLLGLHVHTSLVDDTNLLTQDWTLSVHVEVESWNTMTPRRKSRKSRRKSKR